MEKLTINWGNGDIGFDMRYISVEMPLDKYRRWVKLFARFGKREDHIRLLNELERWYDQYTRDYRYIHKKEPDKEANRLKIKARLYKRKIDLLKGLIK